MQLPTFNEEKNLWQKGHRFIAGVDEVGRGCFAGPVVAAAVILSPDFNAANEINDSKMLSPKKRRLLADIIKKNAVTFSIAEISVPVIDKIGIAEATQRAFLLAVKTLNLSPDFILIDAFHIRKLDKSSQKAIIHGDAISITIAAASIIAKVYRDDLMEKLHLKNPQYDFYSNKGYGTKKHREGIKIHGLCGLHRKSFSLAKYT